MDNKMVTLEAKIRIYWISGKFSDPVLAWLQVREKTFSQQLEKKEKFKSSPV